MTTARSFYFSAGLTAVLREKLELGMWKLTWNQITNIPANTGCNIVY